MKKWSEYSPSEKRMIGVIAVLLLLIVATSGRVHRGMQKGFNAFFSRTADTTEQINR